MSRYAFRSNESELIDQPDIPFADWEVCLRELDIINTTLGGHAITLKGIEKLLKNKKDIVTIAEIGCGGGDNLKAIHRWNRNRIDIKYIGIDINQACIGFAENNCNELPDKEFIAADYKKVDFGEEKPDIIFSSLFCHHFSNEQIIEMLGWLKQNSVSGFFINDLQRHPLAFHSIRLLTQLFSHSYLVKNDAPVSVMRGFKKKEWEQLLLAAGISSYTIRWKWAFRYLVTVYNE